MCRSHFTHPSSVNPDKYIVCFITWCHFTSKGVFFILLAWFWKTRFCNGLFYEMLRNCLDVLCTVIKGNVIRWYTKMNVQGQILLRCSFIHQMLRVHKNKFIGKGKAENVTVCDSKTAASLDYTKVKVSLK